MTIKTIGLDLAKLVFQIHGVDEHGHVVHRKQVSRGLLSAFFANLPPCLVGMEACGSAHFWARKLAAFGHDVRLMAPQFVKPYVKGSKTDRADAEAICEAVRRPNMRFVPIKQSEQQALLALHRSRQGFVKARTAQGNQLCEACWLNSGSLFHRGFPSYLSAYRKFWKMQRMACQE